MDTNIELIEKVLQKIHQNETSLEEALSNVSVETKIKIVENISIIRNYLVEKKLIIHNPRVTFPNQTIDNQNGVEFIADKIHQDFIKDNTTKKYSELIKKNELRNFLKSNK